MKKALIAIAVILCVSVSGYKLYELYQSNTPVAEAGKCIEVQVGEDKAILGILENNDKDGTSVVVSFNNGFVGRFTYADLRSVNAHEVECPQ